MANPRFDEIGTTSSTSDTSTASDTSNTNDAATLRKLTAKGNRKLDKKTVKPKSKTVVTPGTKVSQATIDKIKAMGMKKALAGAGSASAEMREGLKRMYGSKRVGAAAPAKPQSARPQLGGSSKVNSTSGRSASPAGRSTSPAPKRDTSKVISTGGRGVTGAANLKPSSSSNSKTPTYRKPETISTGGRGVTGQGTMKRSTSKSTGKKTSNRMDTLFGKK
jgi:hypothetical protein